MEKMISRRDFIYGAALAGAVLTLRNAGYRISLPIIQDDCPPCPCLEDKPLDGIPDLVGAFSLRQLKSDYAEPCLYARKDGPGEDEAFGFVDGWLDVQSIAAWAGGARITVPQVFDQSGAHQHHIFTGVEDFQPELVLDGFLGKPALVFDGVDDRLEAHTAPFGGGGQNTTALVHIPYAKPYQFLLTNSTKAREVAPLQAGHRLRYYKGQRLIHGTPHTFTGWGVPALWLESMGQEENNLIVNGQLVDNDPELLELGPLDWLILGSGRGQGKWKYGQLAWVEWIVVDGTWGPEVWEPYSASVSAAWGGF